MVVNSSIARITCSTAMTARITFLYSRLHCTIHNVMPNTHRRRLPTVELSLVGVGRVNRIRKYLATTAGGFGRQFGN